MSFNGYCHIVIHKLNAFAILVFIRYMHSMHIIKNKHESIAFVRVSCYYMLLCACISVCSVPLDLMIVIDETEYWQGKFEDVKRGLSSLISQLNVGYDNTHIGIVTFNDVATVQFDLNQYYTLQGVLNALQNIQEMDGVTQDQQVSITTNY